MAVKKLDSSMIIFILLFQVFSIDVYASKQNLISFGKAKGILANKVYGNKNQTFYCSCDYQKKSIKSKSCELMTKKFKKRQKRVEWEHVVPAHAFGHSFKEWREAKTICPKKKGPRKCAAKKNKLFKEMEGNLHNLVPAVGAINALRSNFSFTEIVKNEKSKLCGKGFYLESRKVMPPNSVKGDIARIYFYMNDKYPGRGIISKKNQKLFAAWNKIDPVDQKECEISRLKSQLQGDKNRFVEQYCKE